MLIYPSSPYSLSIQKCTVLEFQAEHFKMLGMNTWSYTFWNDWYGFQLENRRDPEDACKLTQFNLWWGEDLKKYLNFDGAKAQG